MTSSPDSSISRLPDDYPPPPNLDITIRYTPADPLPPPPALRHTPLAPSSPVTDSKSRSVAFSDDHEYLPGPSESYPTVELQAPPIPESVDHSNSPESQNKIPHFVDNGDFWLNPEVTRAFVGRAKELLGDMGLEYNTYLDSDRIFGCRGCKTHLATHENIISRNFRGQHGKAYLFSTVVNILSDEAVERNMTTGKHVVRDIRCKQCAAIIGWKYDKAYEQTEKYKENKFILEAELLCQVF